MPLLGSMVECFEVPGLRPATLVSSNQKELGFGKLCGDLPKGYAKGKALEGQGECSSVGHWGSHDRSYIHSSLFGLLSRAPVGLLAAQNGCQAALNHHALPLTFCYKF